MSSELRLRVTISGVVQGVGFRPFVYRLGTELGLRGFVGNDAQHVFAEVQGQPTAVQEFADRLARDAPPLAVVTDIRTEPISPSGECGRQGGRHTGK